MFSAWRAMLKDLHELHAKYYKRLLYYKGMPCILDERGSNQMLSGFFSVRRICKEMPTDASIWPIKKWLFFHYFCRFLGRSQRWPLHKKGFKQVPSIHQSGRSFQSHFNLPLFHARIFESATPPAIPCQGARVIIRFRRSSCKKKAHRWCLSRRLELKVWADRNFIICLFSNFCRSIISIILEVKNSYSSWTTTSRIWG